MKFQIKSDYPEPVLPLIGETRIIDRFAWLPTVVKDYKDKKQQNNYLIWLCTYTETQVWDKYYTNDGLNYYFGWEIKAKHINHGRTL